MALGFPRFEIKAFNKSFLTEGPKMISAQYIGEQHVAVDSYEAREPLNDEVQIRVFYAGLCGTDLHIVHGNMDKRVAKNLTFGHEMSGVIEKVGSEVLNLKAGDPVTVMPLDWDGTCPACVAGYQHICHNLNFVGIDSPGALQTLWNVKSSWVFKLPSSLSLRDAALVEPLAVAVHDVKRADLSANDKVLIVGGGPIGLLVGLVGKHFGADVRIVELDDSRVELITALGFEAFSPLDTDIAEMVNEWTGGKGADAIFEVSGAASAVLTAVNHLKVRGKLIIVAIHAQPREINLQRVFWRELTIIGVRVYESSDFETAIELLAQGVIPTSKIITHIVPIRNIEAAIATLEQGLAMKVLIDVQNESSEVSSL